MTDDAQAALALGPLISAVMPEAMYRFETGEDAAGAILAALRADPVARGAVIVALLTPEVLEDALREVYPDEAIDRPARPYAAAAGILATMRLRQHARVTADRGWHRGPAVVRWDCADCAGPIPAGSDCAVRDRGGTFVFLHGACLDARRTAHALRGES